MAIVAFLLVSGLVIGVPLYLAMTRWSSRSDRRAAETRRRAAAAYRTEGVPAEPARRRRKVMSG
ncbi:hypothetical protein ACR9E3_23590 [Actinomycetospora sp. C-140]